MIIYSNGCSHTADLQSNSECHPNNTIPDGYYENVYIDVVAKELFNDEYEVVHLMEGFYLKDEKNCNFNTFKNSRDYLLKHASSGKSNDLIFFESYNVIRELIHKNIKLDYVVIQFTGQNRRVGTLPDGRLIPISPSDNSEQGIKFEPFASEQSLQYIVILQDLLKENNINYCFIPYMEFDKYVLDNTDKLKYIDQSNFTSSIRHPHINYFRNNKLVLDIAGHPNRYGYLKLAEMVLTKLGHANLKGLDFSKYFEPYSSDNSSYLEELHKTIISMNNRSKNIEDFVHITDLDDYYRYLRSESPPENIL